jgi:GT2 family glycosyltransferase
MVEINMKADLVIVSHNATKDLKNFLPSIKENTEDYNLVIVDNGSAAEDRAWLENCGEKVIFQENKGYGSACNEGAKAFNSDFIVFLNCDLLASPNWLDDLLKPFDDYDVAITGARLFNEQYQEYPTPKDGWACGACFAVRREYFSYLDGFDQNFFLFFEETDLCVRAIKAGYKVIRSEAELIHYHPHFPPFSFETQKHWDKSKKYFEEKHKKIRGKCSLALVMVVKNEAVGLERAILSCRDFVDEIVISIDRASTDKTEEIAKKYATTLKYFDWEDDFSKARNFAHEGVKSDWILFLDGHEYVAAAPDIEKHLLSKADGLMCTIEMETGFIFGNPRIYRNGLQFEGKVHERQNCKETEVYPDFIVKHDRPGGQSPEAAAEREKQRADQIPRIMGGQYKKDKKNVRASYHLAVYAQSQKRYKDAICWWKRYLKYAKGPGERWFAFYNVSTCHFALGHLFRAFWYISKADDETPGRWESLRLKGLICFQKKKFSQAVEFFVYSFKENTGIVSYKPWVDDIAGTWNLIGECFFNLGFLDKACMAFDRSVKLEKDKTKKKFIGKRAALMRDILKDYWKK